MTGSISKRCACARDRWGRCSHPWWVRASGGRDPITGRRRYATATVDGSRRDAERKRAELIHEQERRGRVDQDAAKRRLDVYLNDWAARTAVVSKRGRPLAPTTRRKYGDTIARVSPVIGHVRLHQLQPAHVEHLRDQLLGRGLAPQTVSDVLRVLGQALRKAVARGLLERNPADPAVVDRPAGKPKPLPVITRELAETILRAVRGTDPWDVSAHLALALTLRREEVLALRWSDVDFDGGTLAVRRTLTFADGVLHEGDPKTAAGERTLALPPLVVDALQRHRTGQARRRLVAGEAWQDLDLIVDRGDGGMISPPSFSTGWRRFAARQGFPDVTFHGLRHGAATLMLAGGVPDPVAVRIMGHADARILRRYQEVVPELLRDAAERMDVLLNTK